MTPFYFGASDRQLFGAYDPPVGGGRRAALICQPWAREYLLAHPTLRHAARSLARAGWHALRFDYFGTGDSAGADDEVSLARWREDVWTAIQELRDISGVQRVTVIGMRLGAAVAASAVAESPDIERLVLWDPVDDGARHIDELRTKRTPWEEAQPVARVPLDPDEVVGAALPASLRAEIEAVSSELYATRLPRTLLLNTKEAATAHEPVAARMVAAGVDATCEHVPDVQVWREEWGRGGVGLAVRAVERISTWLA